MPRCTRSGTYGSHRHMSRFYPPVVFSLRRIRPGDGSRLRQVRLRALLADSEAFGSTYTSEVSRSSDEWEIRATRAAVGETQLLVVAESSETNGEFVGMAGAYQPDDDLTIRELYGMWVAPEARSRGIGLELVEAVKEWSVRQMPKRSPCGLSTTTGRPAASTTAPASWRPDRPGLCLQTARSQRYECRCD
jgi:GNAT superfamily N-acetyltransferase